MKRTIAIFATTAAASIVFAAPAQADVSTNPTGNDALGYCNANHIANFNGDQNGIGWARSDSKGAIADSNRQIHTEGTALNTMCTATQGQYAPISNND